MGFHCSPEVFYGKAPGQLSDWSTLCDTLESSLLTQMSYLCYIFFLSVYTLKKPRHILWSHGISQQMMTFAVKKQGNNSWKYLKTKLPWKEDDTIFSSARNVTNLVQAEKFFRKLEPPENAYQLAESPKPLTPSHKKTNWDQRWYQEK